MKPADQFEAVMQDKLMIEANDELQLVQLKQGESGVVFENAKSMRAVAVQLYLLADKWDRGELFPK